MADGTQNADKPEEGWKDRNRVIKRFKTNGRFGWMHLVIGENKIDRRRFMRILRYMNWFSIPSPEYLVALQQLLKKGAQELGWEQGGSGNIKIAEEKGLQDDSHPSPEQIDNYVPEEIIEFIKTHPRTAKRLIKLVDIDKLKEDDFKNTFDLLNILNDKALSAGTNLKFAFQNVLDKISKEDKKGMEQLSELMDSWSLLQITSLLQIVKKRLNDIEIFEKMIHDDKTYEINTDNSIHRLLEKSMWILDEKYWIVQSNKSLRTFIGDEIEKERGRKRPDFVCVTNGNTLIIIEIKRPSLVLSKTELDQAELYQMLIKKYKSRQYNTIKIILVGNKISDEARELVELRKNVELITYQDFLEDCRRRYQEYLDVIEK